MPSHELGNMLLEAASGLWVVVFEHPFYSLWSHGIRGTYTIGRSCSIRDVILKLAFNW